MSTTYTHVIIDRQAPRASFTPAGRERGMNVIRALDITIAVLALFFFLPLILLVAFILAAQGGPILFSHRRLGQGGRHFHCLKFRSMVIDAEERLQRLLQSDPQARREWLADHKLRNDPRITPFGQFLRRSSLDELPQLINVLRGEMSIVGPRPIVEAEVPRYGHHIVSYFAVKPGITGIWQVSGRNDVDYRTRIAMDCLYAKIAGPRLYLRLVILTVPAVLMRRGSY